MVQTESSNNELKVSVHLITYNQEHFIRGAIEGVLNQKVNFKYELVIGDDFSTDQTRNIIKEYHSKHPEIIKPLYHPHNLGPKGLEGKNNFITTLRACRGKYIALLDGDDYWIDDQKLQTQIDFFEENSDYAISFHQVYEVVNKSKKLTLSDLNKSFSQGSYTIDDLAKGNFIHTPSVVFRNGLIKELPDWFYEVRAGDYVIHMLNARHGKIKYFPQPMAVYRRHAASYWASEKYQERLIAWLKVLNCLITENFSPEVISILKDQRRKILKSYFYCLINEQDYQTIQAELKKYYQIDSELKVWADDFFIEYIKGIKSGKIFRARAKLSQIRLRILRFFKVR